MLASTASENSVTQKQLLDALGRTENLENIEKYYETTLNDYLVRGNSENLVVFVKIGHI